MVIITGANGFIGSVVLGAVNANNIPVSVVTDIILPEERSTYLQNKKFQNFLHKDQLWDFLNKKETQTTTKWIIHIGANSSTTETNKELLYETNTQYTEKLFQWCTQHQVGLIYASSAATYGNGELGYDDEIDSHQLRSLNLYGQSKLDFDKWAIEQKQTPPHWYGLRFFNVYGPNEYHKGSMSSVIYKSYHQIAEKKSFSLFKSYLPDYKDGEQMRDFIYVKDISRWILELMNKKPNNGIYNMGFGQARTWNDLVHAVFKSMQLPSNITYVDMPDNLKNQYQYFTEAKMQKWLKAGMSAPQWSLEDGIQDYVNNHLQKNDKVF